MLRWMFEWSAGRVKTKADEKYWSVIFAMLGVACLAVGVMELRAFPFLAGFVFCLVGQALDRRWRSRK